MNKIVIRIFCFGIEFIIILNGYGPAPIVNLKVPVVLFSIRKGLEGSRLCPGIPIAGLSTYYKKRALLTNGRSISSLRFDPCLENLPLN